ncbi:MAG: dihydropyrimidinase [Bacteroidetes bacterium]|nr:dihydropyrimidinase [Bacteroidota bacterium]
MKPKLIINGTLVSSSSSVKEDLLIENGRITSRGILDPKDHLQSDIIDADGKLIFPGGIDPHVHLALPTPAGPSSDDFISGSTAAVAGGTTTIIDFVTPRRGQSLLEALSMRRAEASGCRIEYRLHMGISEWNSSVAAEVIPCIEKEKIISFKAYLAYRDTIGIRYPELEQLMEVAGPAGGLVMVHCEDGEMISRLQKEFLLKGQTHACYHALSHPAEAEIRAVEKVIELSGKTGCRVYIVHTSTRQATEAIAAAKRSGFKINAETCPHYLLLDEAVYDEKQNNLHVLPYVVSPPMRKFDDREYLWKGLADGTFDTVATDHCPFNLHGQKDQGLLDFTKIPNGAGSIEHRLTLLYTYGVLTNKITLNQFVSLTSERAAEIFGMAGRKGKLEIGYDADVVIWNPEAKKIITAENHVMNCDSDIYDGFPVQGCPEAVMAKGEILFRAGN